jgi:hypothetical protein
MADAKHRAREYAQSGSDIFPKNENILKKRKMIPKQPKKKLTKKIINTFTRKSEFLV